MFDVGEFVTVTELPDVTKVFEEPHEEPVDEYHWYVYGVVPPDGFAVSVIDWPVSIMKFDGVGLPADNDGLTVTNVFPDVNVTGELAALSVTV